jgi:putative ABC transport system permease protein
LDSFLKDLRLAFRSLLKSPFLTLVAAFSLAIGIGANGAIFSAVDVFMIRPLPYPDSQELGFVWTTNQERGWTSVSNSLLDYLDWREESRSMDLGFEAQGLLTMEMDLPESQYPGPQELGIFQRDLLDRLAALPGVESTALATMLPTQGHQAVFYSLPTVDLPSEDRRPVVGVRTVSPAYFATMGIPLARGRGFTEGDDANAPAVLVVNEAFANQHWPNADPLGEEVAFEGAVGEIVGVVGDVRVFGPSDEAPAMIYFSSFAGPERGPSLAIRTTRDPLALANPIREVVNSLDPDQPIYSVAEMETVLRDSTGGETIMAKIMGVLAIVAFVLALIGVYGVMAYTVSRRIHEIGIRMALGADSGSVMVLVLRQGAILAAVGVGIGILLSLAATRGLSFFLFGVSPFNLPIFAGVAGVLLGASVLATLLPARKATRVDPLIALRSE